jgi:hypothetical protein
MEKMPETDECASRPAPLLDQSSFDSLAVAFDPLTLRRPLSLFGGALSLRAGIVERPDPDFPVHLLEGCSHQERVRKGVGAQFKNLEHFLRGMHVPTATTWSALLMLLGTDEASLRSLAHGRRDGPLLPAYLAIFQGLEGVFVRTYRGATVGTVKCPCCGGDVLDDARVWWAAQALPLDEDACNFVDRLLSALLGAVCVLSVLGHFRSSVHLDGPLLEKLAQPDQHPMGNWIDMAQRARGLRNDWELTMGMDTTEPGAGGPVSDGRLRKWRAGGDLLPLDKAFTMVAATRQETVLRHALLAARTLGLAIDVVRAAAATPDRPQRRPAQEIIAARLRTLALHLQIGVAALAQPKSATARS